MKKFAYLEVGEGSSDEFLKWQAKMKANDMKTKQEQIKRDEQTNVEHRKK